MKGSLWALFRGARRPEWIAAAAVLAALCLLLVAGTRGGEQQRATEMEARVAQTLSQIEGAGRVRVVIGEDAGVLVVAEGADDLRVSLALTRAVRALLDIPAAKIEVMKMR